MRQVVAGMEGDKAAETGSLVSAVPDHLSSTPVPDGIKMPQIADKDLVEDEDKLDDDSQHDRRCCEETPCTLEESRCLPDDDEVIVKVHQEDGQNEEGEEEECDQEETEPEMTQEQMKAMYDAVRTGNIDLMDDLLDLPGADINMEWFSESLLMTALRNRQPQMAMFLIDNGIDYNYTTTHMDMDETSGVIDWYTVDCRQIAYELEYWDIVDLIDEKNGTLWPHSAAKRRYIRYKKTPGMKIKEREESEKLEENGRELTDSEGRRTLSRSERSEYSDDSSLDLTEDENLDGTGDEDISEGSDSSGQQTGDVSVDQLRDVGMIEIGDESFLHAGDGNAQKIGDTGMDQTINSRRAGCSDVQVTGDGSVQETGDDIVRQAEDKQDNNLQGTCDTMRHTGDGKVQHAGDGKVQHAGGGKVQHAGDIVQNKGDTNIQGSGVENLGQTAAAKTEHREENNTAMSRANKQRVNASGFTTAEKNGAEGCKKELSAGDRNESGAEPEDSATKHSGSAPDDASSGYSTMSSRESRPELASQQRVVHQIGTTKSYLSRKTANACLRSGSNRCGDLPPITTVSGIGSFCHERKLWSADSGLRRPTSECGRRRHPEIVTYRPWSYSADYSIYETDATRCSGYKNLLRLGQHQPYTQRKSHGSCTGSYVMPKGYRVRRSNTELLIYSSGALSDHKPRSSPIVLDIPITRSYIQTSVYRPVTRATDYKLRARQTGESSLTGMTSVIRNRIAAGNPGQAGVRWLQSRKYSPAGHLKYTTKKRHV